MSSNDTTRDPFDADGKPVPGWAFMTNAGTEPFLVDYLPPYDVAAITRTYADRRARLDPATLAALNAEPEPVWHIVSTFQHWFAWLLRRPSRAMCGELMVDHPDQRDIPDDAPECPDCVSIKHRR